MESCATVVGGVTGNTLGAEEVGCGTNKKRDFSEKKEKEGQNWNSETVLGTRESHTTEVVNLTHRPECVSDCPGNETGTTVGRHAALLSLNTRDGLTAEPGNDKIISMSDKDQSMSSSPTLRGRWRDNTTVDAKLSNFVNSPVEVLASPTQWRHDPYKRSTASSIAEFPNTKNHQFLQARRRSGDSSGSPADPLAHAAQADFLLATQKNDVPLVNVRTRGSMNASGHNAACQKNITTAAAAATACIDACRGMCHSCTFSDSSIQMLHEEEEPFCQSKSPAFMGTSEQLLPELPLKGEVKKPCQRHFSFSKPCFSENLLPNRQIDGLHGTKMCHELRNKEENRKGRTRRAMSNSLSSLQGVAQYNDALISRRVSGSYQRSHSMHSAISSSLLNGSFDATHDLIMSPRLSAYGALQQMEFADHQSSRLFCNCDFESISFHQSLSDNTTFSMQPSGFFPHNNNATTDNNNSDDNIGNSAAAGNTVSQQPTLYFDESNGVTSCFPCLTQMRNSTSELKNDDQNCGSDDKAVFFCMDNDINEDEAHNKTLTPNEANAVFLSNGGLEIAVKEQQSGECFLASDSQVAARKSNTVDDTESCGTGACGFSTLTVSTKLANENVINGQQHALPQQGTESSSSLWRAVEQKMLESPREEVMCFAGQTFSVYDAELQQHYLIESTNVVATRGAVEYLKMTENRGAQSRCRFQLCKRYLNKRCSQGSMCQYIHARYVPPSTFVHINENVITTAVVEGREMPQEMLRGGKNKHGYETIQPGVIFRVHPPNQNTSLPQLIPSEFILRTFGASNIYSALVQPTKGKVGDNGVFSDGSDIASGGDFNNINVKARHCAHFQFNKMCNLGASCNFIHSLVPYVQRLSMPLSVAPFTTTAAVSQSVFISPNQVAPYFAYNHGGAHGAAGCHPYPAMDFLQQTMMQIPPPPPGRQLAPLLQPPAATAARCGGGRAGAPPGKHVVDVDAFVCAPRVVPTLGGVLLLQGGQTLQ